MPSAVRFRVVSPIPTTNKARAFVTLSVGSVIETSVSLNDPGLHSVMFGNEELFAFTRDSEERSEPIDQPAESEEVIARENFAGRS
jgi:hypothetical protein